jgi:hypothetical protein
MTEQDREKYLLIIKEELDKAWKNLKYF